MPATKKSRPLFLFYLLVAYVFLQFTWWSYLMFQLNNEVYELKTELIHQSAIDEMDVAIKNNELQKKLHLRWTMILGEGSVFLTLLVLGIIQTRSAFKKENALLNQQRNFLLSVTHELKSPIASMRLQMETLLHRDLDVSRQKEILTNAVADTDRLNSLVENILLAARIENSAYVLYKEQVNLSAFVENTVNGMVTVRSRVRFEIEPDIKAEIDKQGFHSIIQNLLENAVKYSPANSPIVVGLHRRNGEILFFLKDEGKGIPVHERENIFQKFYRIGNEETRSAKGTGLGLYIAKNLAELHDATISVRDNTPKGSVFEVTMRG